MRSVVIALVLSTLMPGQPAWSVDAPAYEKNIREEANLPSAWFSCKTDKDCGLASVPCAASIAVNSSHTNEASAAICKRYGCGGCNATMMDTSAALCHEGQCVTIFTHTLRTSKTPDVQLKATDLHVDPGSLRCYDKDGNPTSTGCWLTDQNGRNYKPAGADSKP
jgi:hypothetical protein